MKIGELCKALNAEVQAPGDTEREISKITAGDLLSFVMGTAPEGAAWVTIQAHLKDLPIIIIAAGRKAPDDLVERCITENICVASVSDTLYAACCKLGALGLGE